MTIKELVSQIKSSVLFEFVVCLQIYTQLDDDDDDIT